jgi:hypothetical protein
MLEEHKKAIDAMNYTSLLRLWRNAPSPHPYFQGDTGLYYDKVMREKRDEVGAEGHTLASKAIGWGG